MRELQSKMLLNDLTVIGCPTDFILDIRGYSKKYFALYDPNIPKVILYPYQDKLKTKLFSYGVILKHAVHEVCHHIQWSNPDFIRYKGVMHSPEFYKLFNEYWGRAKALLLLREVKYEKDSYIYTDTVHRNYSTSIIVV